MNLRRKLLITFGSLALLGLVTAGVSIWTTVQWEATNEQLQQHYTRSLQAERIRADTFRAIKEIPDALAARDDDARQEFGQAVSDIDEEFETWSKLADNQNERQQVQRVRQTYDQVMRDAQRFFDLVEAGRRDEARELLEEDMEENSFQNFQQATEQAVASDGERRQGIRSQVDDTRRIALLMESIAAFGTVSLLMLLGAYLVSDLFRPLKEVKEALEDLGKGDLDRRLDEERADELGGINRAFNHAVESLSERERLQGLAAEPNGDEEKPDWQYTPSRTTLHRMVSHLRSRVVNLNGHATGSDPESVAERRALVEELDNLSQTVVRMTEFGFPLDLNLSRTDVRALLYRVFMRFQDEFAERAISLDLEIEPEVDYAVVDRLKLREATGELLRNALAALPERGGHLGLRSRLSEESSELLIEVADDGSGADQSLIDEVFDQEYEDEGQPRTGLALVRAIAEQHGGHVEIDTEPGEGTYARIQIPLRGE